MKRFSIKTTEQVKEVMMAVAEKRNKDASDLIYEHFYQLAKSDLSEISSDADTLVALDDIFYEAILL